MVKNIVLVLVVFISLQQGLSGQLRPGYGEFLLPGANFRLYPSETSQTEVFIVRSPLDDDLLFASCNTLTFIPFFVSEGIYISEDAGFSWQGNDTCTGDPIGFHGGDPGIAIEKDGNLILTRLGRTPFTGLYSHYSTDNGLTWSSQAAVSTDDLERATLISDAYVQSGFYGRTYAAWVKFANPFPVMFSYADDITQGWSEPVPVNNPVNRSAGGDVILGPEGEVYICWAGVTSVSPFREIFVGFASSGNGGENWNVTENAFEVNGITGILPEKQNIRVNGLPGIGVDTTEGAYSGNIYIVTGQKELPPAGNDPDIILYRSEDKGLTWSEGIRVNQDEISNGKIQFFPSIHVDRYGAVNIIYYDDRNTTSDSSGVFLSRSTDAGETWTEYEISDHNFKPVPIGGLGQGYMGDNIDITSTSTHLWPVWMDNSTGNYQVWTSPVDFSSLNSLPESAVGESETRLLPCYPNPFTGTTRIKYYIGSGGEVSLKVYDIFGNVVAEPVNERKRPGYHEISFNPQQGLSRGVYFVRLYSARGAASQKVILK